jgi:hypothetical protein
MSPDTHTPERENPRTHAYQHGFSYLRDTAQTQTPGACRDPDRHELIIFATNFATNFAAFFATLKNSANPCHT